MKQDYEGDKEMDGKVITIDKCGMKGGDYIYYFTEKNSKKYDREYILKKQQILVPNQYIILIFVKHKR